jgi:hypothetical protein
MYWRVAIAASPHVEAALPSVLLVPLSFVSSRLGLLIFVPHEHSHRTAGRPMGTIR